MQKVFNFYQKVKFTFLNQHHIWPIWYVFACISGICLFFSLSYDPKPDKAIVGILLAIYLYAKDGKILRKLNLKLISKLLIFFCIGFLSAYIRTSYLSPLKHIETVKPITISGNIDYIDQSGTSDRYIISKLRIDDLNPKDLPQRIRVTSRIKPKLQLNVGDRVIFDARIFSPKLPDIHEGFDYSRWLFFNNIQATGYVIGRVTKLKYGHISPSSIQLFFKSLRESVKNNIDKNISTKDNAALLKAVLTGDKTYLSTSTREEITNSGLAHLLAISGLHMSIVAGFIFVLLRVVLSAFYKLFLQIPASKIAAVCTMFFCFIYLQLANLPISATRAYIMVCIILLAILLARRISPLRSLAIAALVICIFTPEAVLGPSMQMSFAAVLCILIIYKYLDSKVGAMFKDKEGSITRIVLVKTCKYFVLVMLSTGVASLATSVYAIYHFNRFSSVSVLANLFAIPLASFIIMPFAILAMLTSVLGIGLEYPFYIVASWGADIIFYLSSSLGDKANTLSAPSISPWQIYLFTAGMLWVLVWQSSLRYLGIILIVASGTLFYTKEQPDIIISASGKNFAIKENGEYYTYKKDRSYFYRSINENMFLNDQTIAKSENLNSKVSCNSDSCDVSIKDDEIRIPLGQKLPQGTTYLYMATNKQISAKDYVGDRKWYVKQKANQ